MDRRVFVLVQGRRPIFLEDENDSEYAYVILKAYNFLMEQKIPAEKIFVLTKSKLHTKLNSIFSYFFALQMQIKVNFLKLHV